MNGPLNEREIFQMMGIDQGNIIWAVIAHFIVAFSTNINISMSGTDWAKWQQSQNPYTQIKNGPLNESEILFQWLVMNRALLSGWPSHILLLPFHQISVSMGSKDEAHICYIYTM